jgi:SAM-dependent methyltransferase
MSFARNYRRWILGEFMPYLRGSVAEVGAGTGSFSTLLLGSGIERLTAFEPSQNMYPLLAEAVRLHARATAVQDYFGKESGGRSYDAIVYVNVMEHIEDDAGELANVRRALALNGHLLIFVPALPWLYSDLDRQLGHFRRYTKSGLVDLVQRAGLSVVKAKYFDLAGIAPWYVSHTVLGHSLTPGRVALFDRTVVPLMSLVERLVPPPIGKNVLLVATRAK